MNLGKKGFHFKVVKDIYDNLCYDKYVYTNSRYTPWISIAPRSIRLDILDQKDIKENTFYNWKEKRARDV